MSHTPCFDLFSSAIGPARGLFARDAAQAVTPKSPYSPEAVLKPLADAFDPREGIKEQRCPGPAGGVETADWPKQVSPRPRIDPIECAGVCAISTHCLAGPAIGTPAAAPDRLSPPTYVRDLTHRLVDCQYIAAMDRFNVPITSDVNRSEFPVFQRTSGRSMAGPARVPAGDWAS